jgi:WD40 repeat protein
VRLFDLNKVDMEAKFVPHSSAVTAIAFSQDGRVILSGGRNGLLIVSSSTTGMTLRALGDHKGAAILSIEVCNLREGLWLAVSTDARMSVWQSDWSKDRCELVDWVPIRSDQRGPCLSRAEFSYTDGASILFGCESSQAVSGS